MKFYVNKDFWNFFSKIIIYNFTCVHYDSIAIRFFKNGKRHNSKNAAYINYNGYKEFYLNGQSYGYEYDFTKLSWRKFTKLQAFL